MRRQPFPKPGEKLLDAARPSGLHVNYGSPRRSLLQEFRASCDGLKLTVGGRIALGGFGGVGLLGGIVGTGAAVYNVVSGTDPDIAGGAQLAFTWLVVAIFEVVTLGVVVTLDAVFRGIRSAVRAIA